MADSYTHTFEFQIGDQTIEGEVEFNEDGITTFKTEEAFDGLSITQVAKINEIFNAAKDVFHEFGSITKIEINEK